MLRKPNMRKEKVKKKKLGTFKNTYRKKKKAIGILTEKTVKNQN